MSPFAILPANVIQAWPSLSPKGQAVAVAVASFMNRWGECWPSIAALGERAGLSRRYSVSLALRELGDRGLLEVERRGHHRSNVCRWAAPARSVGSKRSGPAKNAHRPREKRVVDLAKNAGQNNLTEGDQGTSLSERSKSVRADDGPSAQGDALNERDFSLFGAEAEKALGLARESGLPVERIGQHLKTMCKAMEGDNPPRVPLAYWGEVLKRNYTPRQGPPARDDMTKRTAAHRQYMTAADKKAATPDQARAAIEAAKAKLKLNRDETVPLQSR